MTSLGERVVDMIVDDVARIPDQIVSFLKDPPGRGPVHMWQRDLAEIIDTIGEDAAKKLIRYSTDAAVYSVIMQLHREFKCGIGVTFREGDETVSAEDEDLWYFYRSRVEPSGELFRESK